MMETEIVVILTSIVEMLSEILLTMFVTAMVSHWHVMIAGIMMACAICLVSVIPVVNPYLYLSIMGLIDIHHSETLRTRMKIVFMYSEGVPFAHRVCLRSK